MSKAPIHERIAEQFSYRGEHADVWRAFDRLLATEAYLNLGYSPHLLPHVVGSSQRRLARLVGEGLAIRLGDTGGLPLVDVGCGRGGPAAVLAESFGFDVVGVDLVRYNVAAARGNAAQTDASAAFVVGDAPRLPIATDAVEVATSIDTLVYVPDERAAFEEVTRVVRSGGLVATSNLLAERDLDAGALARVEAFAEAWDMPGIAPVDRYVEGLASAGFDVDSVRDLSPHSVDRFRKWTRLYLAVAERWPGLLERVLAMWDLDADPITRQVRTAHRALPHLRHVLVYARVE